MPPSPAADDAASSRQRNRLFTVIALLLPLLACLALEGLLRLGGFARPEPLFVPAQRDGWMQPNERVVQRFFPSPSAAPDTQIDTTLFRAQRDPDGLRIVVQGGSTAAGFPFGKWASLAGALQKRISGEQPGRSVEVISTAMSAVNSYTLWDFGEEIVDLEPDAVVIYAGHNEYLGILGVGSTWGTSLSAETTRRLLRLRDFRLLALANRLWTTLTGAGGEAREGTLMARVAREREIPFGSGLFQAGLDQFESNMTALLTLYEDAGIPVLLGTVAANERDQPPLLPLAGAGAVPADRRDQLEGLLDEGTDPTLLDQARALADAHPEDPSAHYLLGRALLAAGEAQAARRAFVTAKDLDLLRFRAPEAINDIIASLAERHGAMLVDVQGRLIAASPPGGIGNELMVEHLHPNRDGYFLLADTYHDGLTQQGLLPPADATTGEAEALFPLSRIEALAGEYRVARLLSDWPFQDPPQPLTLPPPEDDETAIAQAWFLKQQSWVQAMNAGLKLYQRTGDFEEAARIASNMALALPFEASAQYAAGLMYLRNEQPQRALPFLDAAARLNPGEIRYRMSLAQAYYMAGFPAESLEVLEAVLAVDPTHGRATEFATRLRGELASQSAAD